jgi:hypothetical protein
MAIIFFFVVQLRSAAQNTGWAEFATRHNLYTITMDIDAVEDGLLV